MRSLRRDIPPVSPAGHPRPAFNGPQTGAMSELRGTFLGQSRLTSPWRRTLLLEEPKPLAAVRSVSYSTGRPTQQRRVPLHRKGMEPVAVAAGHRAGSDQGIHDRLLASLHRRLEQPVDG